jgi:hypothetical protein
MEEPSEEGGQPEYLYTRLEGDWSVSFSTVYEPRGKSRDYEGGLIMGARTPYTGGNRTLLTLCPRRAQRFTPTAISDSGATPRG